MLITAGIVALAVYKKATNDALAMGDAIFHGTAALPGRLAGQTAALPVIATRCSNCHEASAGAPKLGVVALSTDRGRDNSRSYASVLDRASLESARPRRGGPASQFNATNLCTLLRTGVDPAQVMVPATMPRYNPTDAQCDELWAYLVSR